MSDRHWVWWSICAFLLLGFDMLVHVAGWVMDRHPASPRKDPRR